ncbi:nuclear transport factor 2 family protein [Psychrobacillus sp. Sa2BUA9]|uniref:Nuclear transport factor 2 family protein n=1 Tax=Psychrobacillus faecigallinarum TaxID=2762235 RepID=A0ABR8R5H7_9BACI|nr:nuclear transport factor 2 family protein [Psychrobacillus faecigallinarum]MBD7943052.1 nuclear transport factor 2 family protein [Psychrobacillus faecigallinarum]
MRLIIQVLTLAAITLGLAACNDKEEVNPSSGSVNDSTPSQTESAIDHGAEDKSDVGFQMSSGGDIEEAANVPEEEKTAVLNAFNEYIEAFNEEDIDRYLSVISKKPEGFNYESEKELVLETFENYDTVRTAEDVTIIEYNDKEAQVYSNIHIALHEPGSGAKLDRNGRQVTVFVKEEGKWVVTSVYFIGETTE